MKSNEFQEVVWQKGRELYREMPWRSDTRPYYVLVSELMLQQTQVDRVIPKFEAFVARFPDEAALATVPLSEVLALWNGLGYNRRAKFLHDAAKEIIGRYENEFPRTQEALLQLPGVGKNTAGAILTYAFNEPVPFIETNVRTVYFHHFFPNGEVVDDTRLQKLVAETMDDEHPREFYWALMDYGAWLKKQGAGKLTQSKHYKKQSVLKGSVREVRGQIIRALATHDMSKEQLACSIDADERFEKALTGLMKDGLIMQTNGMLHLTK